MYAEIGLSPQGQDSSHVFPVEYSLHDNVQYSELSHIHQSAKDEKLLDSKGSRLGEDSNLMYLIV